MWEPSRTGEAETFESESAQVNVSFIKWMLNQSSPDIRQHPTAGFLYDPKNSRLQIRPETYRQIYLPKLDRADVSLPLILAVIPGHKMPGSSEIKWCPDIVDGAHRLARAIRDGLQEIPVILADPFVSVAAASPKSGWEGPISTESDFHCQFPKFEDTPLFREKLCRTFDTMVGSAFLFDPLNPCVPEIFKHRF